MARSKMNKGIRESIVTRLVIMSLRGDDNAEAFADAVYWILETLGYSEEFLAEIESDVNELKS